MKFTSTWCMAFAVSLLSVATAGWAKEYVIDPEHTSIHFRIGHWHFSRVQGRFNRISGSFSFDPANPTASRVHVVVDVGSIDTNQKERDDHLRAPAYFNVQRHPKAIFRSTRIVVTGKDTGRMMGNLTMLGVTKPVTLEVKFNGIAPHPFGTRFKKYKGVVIAGFSAQTKIERSKFGMTNGKGEKGEIVELSIEVEGWQK